MLGGADNSNGELPSYIIGANNDISHADAREFWSLWERNFMAYHEMGVFTVRTLWES